MFKWNFEQCSKNHKKIKFWESHFFKLLDRKKAYVVKKKGYVER